MRAMTAINSPADLIDGEHGRIKTSASLQCAQPSLLLMGNRVELKQRGGIQGR